MHSDARTGQGYQQEVLNPAPDGCETPVALNSGGGRGEQPDMATRKCFFAPQYICLTICRVAKPSGIAVRRNKLQEGKWVALLKTMCQLPAGNFSLYFPAFLLFMQSIAEERGSRRNVSVSSNVSEVKRMMEWGDWIWTPGFLLLFLLWDTLESGNGSGKGACWGWQSFFVYHYNRWQKE